MITRRNDMNFIQRCAITALTASLAACSTVMPAASSGFLSSCPRLFADDARTSTGARAQVDINPTLVTVGDIEWRAELAHDISADEQAMLLAQLRQGLQDSVKRMPASPQGQAVVLRAAITRVKPVSPLLNAASTLLLFVPVDRGGAAVEIEAVDPQTGKQLAGMCMGYFTPLSEIKAQFSKLAPAQLALMKAINDFVPLLQQRSKAHKDTPDVSQVSLSSPRSGRSGGAQEGTGR
jgi:hypothetical protein